MIAVDLSVEQVRGSLDRRRTPGRDRGDQMGRAP